MVGYSLDAGQSRLGLGFVGVGEGSGSALGR